MPTGPIMVDIAGTSLTDEDKELILHPSVGGLIYFARNFESATQIQQLSASIASIRPELLIAVDQEGGRVQRFKEGFTRLPAMQRFLPLYRKNPDAALRIVEDCGWLMAVELLAVGVDFSFAPVLDTDDCQCEVIADRAFSPNPKEVSALAGAFIAGMNTAGMSATGKHFPGHGSVKGDSHKVLPIDSRSYDEIAQHDLIPFVELMDKLQGLMPAHIIFSQVDKHPVGFSSYWLQTVLRQQLGYRGVVFSDDLSMEGAAFAGEYPSRAMAALDAGCDMALVCNDREGAKAIIESITIDHWSDDVTVHQQRLLEMKPKAQWTMDDLKNHDRAIQTRQFLSAMTSV